MLRIDIPYIKSFSRKTLPFASAFISNNVIYQSNLIILPLLHGTYYSGIFQNAYIFIITLTFIPLSFARVFISYLYQQKCEENVDKFQFAFEIITKSYVFISFYISIILFMYADFIVTTIFGLKYGESVIVLKILSISIPFIFNAAVIILTALDKQSIYSNFLKYIAAVSVILNIVLCYLFRDKGIAAATVITFFLIFILSNCLIKHNSELSVRNSIIYYLKGLFIFFTCWMAHGYLTFEYTVVSMFVISLLFCFLNFFLLFTKDDLRIAKEILGRTG